ncbi:MAG: hypothetical protein RIS92_250 [Verrucomicrobiota bacterium]
MVFGEFANGDEIDGEDVADEFDGLVEEEVEWCAVEGECTDAGDGFLADGFGLELAGGFAEFGGSFVDALFEGFLGADDGFAAFLFGGDVVEEADHAAFFSGGVWEEEPDGVDVNERSVFVGESELEIEGETDGDGGLKGLVDAIDVSEVDHGAETVAAVSEVFDGVAEDFFGMAAEGDVIGDGVPVEEDLAGGHDGGFVAGGPFTLILFDAFAFGNVAQGEGEELDSATCISLCGNELGDLKEISVVAFDGSFAFPVGVFDAAGDGFLDEGLVVVRRDDVADVEMGWVGVVLEAKERVCGAVEVDDLTGGGCDDDEVGGVFHDRSEAADFFLGVSACGDVDHDADGSEGCVVWGGVVELGGGFEDDPAGGSVEAKDSCFDIEES